MKKRLFSVTILFALFTQQLVVGQNSNAHASHGYLFTNLIEIPTTKVKDQGNSGTCWSYATTSFLETELLRMGKDDLNLSEMYFVRYAYPQKAQKYIRYQGHANFSEGGQAHDVFNIIRDYGFVTEDDYAGKKYELNYHDHTEMLSTMKSSLDNSLANIDNYAGRCLITIDSILNLYMGQAPTEITYKGTKITPKSFSEKMEINPANYIEFTSYSSYPFYKKVNLEIPDNWSHDTYYNLPIDELMNIINYAMEKGFSVIWDGDMSETGFSHKNGVAIIPNRNPENMSPSEIEKWNKIDATTKEELLFDVEEPIKEMQITQETRQQSFDSFRTTDDHLMHLIGTAKDQNGTLYYITKNSWAENSNNMGGKLNMSESFVRLKTVAILVHKDALPSPIKKKLNLGK